MPSISSLGIGSGLDLDSLLTKIQSAESASLTAITKQQSAYNTKLSAYGQLKSALAGFQTAAAALGAQSLYGTVTAASSSTATLAASADTTAAAGNYTVNVTQLAQAQSLVSAGQASAATAIGGGTVTLELGTTSAGTFTPGSAAAVQIDIAAGSSLLDIRDAINKANAGVTASIVNDGSGTPYRLAISANSSGAASTMRISVSDNGGDSSALASVVAYDPAGTSAMTQTMAGLDAKLSLNGIDVTSASNTVAGAAQGVTLTLQATGTSLVAVKSDKAAISGAVQNFVTAYNKLQGTLASLTAYDPTSKTGSPLLGDATTRGIQTQIRAALNGAQPASGANGLSTLMEVGIGFQADGTMSLDSAKLNDALTTNLTGVQQLFAGADGKSGFGNQISKLATGFTGYNGSLTNATDGINKSLRTLGDQYNAQSDRINTMMDGYRAQFTQLDLLMNQMNSTSSYLTQQFSAMNGASRSK